MSRLSNLIKNIRFLMKGDLEKYLYEKFLFNKINNYYCYNRSEEEKVWEELKYIREKKQILCQPYPPVKMEKEPESGYDNSLKLPYVIHEGKKLYFPADKKIKSAVNLYKSFIEDEHILERGEDKNRPHQYQGGNIFIEKGDILLDIGSAEGLFALDNIEKVSKVYLFESDPNWYAPLEATFAPYKDKCRIIKKLVSDKDTEKSVTLEKVLENEKDANFFLKMDIEGNEEKALSASLNFLRNNKIKASVCTYHLWDSCKNIPEILSSCGFEGDFSKGYMLFYMYDMTPPYFRKAIYRARNY